MPVFIHVAVQCDECQRAATGLCLMSFTGIGPPVIKEKGWSFPKDVNKHDFRFLCPDHAKPTIHLPNG